MYTTVSPVGTSTVPVPSQFGQSTINVARPSPSSSSSEPAGPRGPSISPAPSHFGQGSSSFVSSTSTKPFQPFDGVLQRPAGLMGQPDVSVLGHTFQGLDQLMDLIVCAPLRTRKLLPRVAARTRCRAPRSPPLLTVGLMIRVERRREPVVHRVAQGSARRSGASSFTSRIASRKSESLMCPAIMPPPRSLARPYLLRPLGGCARRQR